MPTVPGRGHGGVLSPALKPVTTPITLKPPVTTPITLKPPVTTPITLKPPVTTPTTLKPVTTPTVMVFLTQLAASQAAGVAGILLSLADNGGLQIEELNSKGEMIVGFTLYAVGDANTQKTTGVAVIQIGSSNRTPSPFTPEQQSAWSLIANELQQYQALNTPKPAVGTEVKVPEPTQGRLDRFLDRRYHGRSRVCHRCYASWSKPAQ